VSSSTDPAVAFPVPRAFLLLFIAIVATGMGQSMLFAVLAPLGREIQLSEIQVGSIISASSITFFLCSNLWGRVSDRIGRRRVILIGLLGYTLGSSLFASSFYAALTGLVAPTGAFITLTLTRMAQSSVMSATPPAASALVADITTRETRTRGMGYIGAAQNVGAIAGPAIGGLLASISLLLPIWCAAGLTLVAAVLVYLLLPEPRGRTSLARSERLRYTDPRILPFVVVGVVMFVGFAVVQQTLAFRLQDTLSLDGSQTARVYGFAVMFSAAGSLLAQIAVVQRLDLAPMRLLRLSMPNFLLGFALIANAEREVSFLIGMAILGIGLGLAAPGFVAGASVAVTGEEQGAVAGVTSSCPPLGFTIGPLIGTFLYQFDGRWPYVAAFVMYLPLALFTFIANPIPSDTSERISEPL